MGEILFQSVALPFRGVPKRTIYLKMRRDKADNVLSKRL